jgi:phosphoglycolate phosphatase-like HAD superfamily hydrolase
VLLLFDIDGTLLLRASAAHAAALLEALHVVHGVTAREQGVQAAGRTDADIARQLLVHAGVSAEQIDARADDVRIAACEAYARLCPDDLSDRVAPGMAALLERMAAREDTTMALVTGNYEPIARIKLRAAGIGRYFATGQGGFGSDDEDRAMLPAIARRRAGSAAAAGDDGEPRPWPRARTAVIGDTPRDIACARADGVRVAAIATGPFGPEALRAADAVARDADELGAVLEHWLAMGTSRLQA